VPFQCSPSGVKRPRPFLSNRESGRVISQHFSEELVQGLDGLQSPEPRLCESVSGKKRESRRGSDVGTGAGGGERRMLFVDTVSGEASGRSRERERDREGNRRLEEKVEMLSQRIEELTALMLAEKGVED